MSQEHNIDYGVLIEGSIKDFQPARRLWPAGARLICWILLNAAILGLAVWSRDHDNLSALVHNSGRLTAAGLFLGAGVAAAFIALKSAIPGREVTSQHWALTIALVLAAFGSVSMAGEHGGGTLIAPMLTLQLLGLSAAPWLALFWAVRRAVPLQPQVTGAAVGLAASCIALGLCQIISEPIRAANVNIVLALSGTLVVALSAVAGGFWLNWIARWQEQGVVSEASTSKWVAFKAGTFFPLALGVSVIALLFVLESPSLRITREPDFDLAIASYERALVDFHPNVPSSSIEAMLTAYVEHGMPAYMWDFGPEGFKLVGGLWNPLPDGTPVTYTWFRGSGGGVMCMFRQTEGFNPPSIAHDQHGHLFFYRYRGFSLCLINVGGYGNFISVIASPMPLDRLEHLVLATTL